MDLIKGILAGTGNTAKSAVQGTGRQAMSRVPNPAQMAYGLGLGIGPLIRNIVAASKTKDTKQTSKQADTVQQKAVVAQQRSMEKMTAQLALSNTLLKEIRNLQIKQIKAQQPLGRSGARSGTLFADRRIQGGSATALGSMGDAASAMKTKAIDSGPSMEGVTQLLGLALGAGGAAGIWKLLPDQIKERLQITGKQIADDVGDSVVSGIGQVLQLAWGESKLATILGGLLVAKLTGVLGLVTAAASTALTLGKGAYNLGKIITSPFRPPAAAGTVAPGAAAAATAAAGTTAAAGAAGRGAVSPVANAGATKAEGFGNTIRRTLGMEQVVVGKRQGVDSYGVPSTIKDAAKEYKDLSKFAGAAQADEAFLSRYGAKNLEAIKSTAGISAEAATAAGAASNAAGAATKAGGAAAESAGTLSKFLKGAGKALGGIGVLATGWSAKENFEQGNNTLGTLDTISAATGAGAMVAAASGVGVPVAAVLGGISAVTGIASAIGSMFVDNKKTDGTGSTTAGQTQGPSPTATQLSAGGTIPGVDNNKLMELVGKFESSGRYGLDNKEGFVGKYQIGAEALETLGLMKPGSSKGRTKGTNSAVYDPSAWKEGYSLQSFLQDKDLQDKVAMKLMKMNYDGLVKRGIITPDMSEADVASRLYTAWHGGVGGAVALFRDGKAREDFKFKGVTTKTSADKMLSAYGGSSATGNAYASSGPSEMNAMNVSSSNALVGSMFAQQQDAFNQVASAIAGQQVKIDFNNIVNNAMKQAAPAGGTAPSRNESSKHNLALEQAKMMAGT